MKRDSVSASHHKPTFYAFAYQTNYLNIENKCTSHKQYLFGLLFSGNPKKTHTDQSIVQVFLLFEKKRLTNLQKYSNCEKPFLQCVCYCYNLLR